MARAVRLYRSECVVNKFGQVLLEIKEDGIRLVSREIPRKSWSWTWDYLHKMAEADEAGQGPSPVSAEMM